MFQFSVIILLFINYCSCGANLNGRIIGGTVANVGQFPFMAAIEIQLSSGSKHFCGGAVLSQIHIITSGFCIYGAQSFTVYLGTINLQELPPESFTAVTNISYIHPEFDPRFIRNDLGIIQLRSPVPFTQYVYSIGWSEEILKPETIVQTVGWGQTKDDDPKPLVDILRWVYISTIDNSDCTEVYGNVLYEDTVCAEGKVNQGICIGDSGGPLFVYDETGPFPGPRLAGIGSFVSTLGCEQKHPSGFVRIYNHLGWIRNVTGLNKNDPEM